MGITAYLVGIALIVVCLCLGYLTFRRVRLMRGGGVDICLRRRPAVLSPSFAGGAGWHFGVGRYRGNELAWYRLTSLWPGSTVVVNRGDLQIVERRVVTGEETYAVPAEASVLWCRIGGTELELAMAPGVLTGFLSWLEAAPPGHTTGYRQAS